MAKKKDRKQEDAENQEQEEDTPHEGSMTRQDAGRMGGETTKERYGSDFYSNIGREGGKARGENR